MIYIFDVEGTLSKSEWRVPLLPPKGLNHVKSAEYYAEFHGQFPKDEPFLPMVNLLRKLYSDGAEIFILTGMMERHRENLNYWLEEHSTIPFNQKRIIMRSDNDFSSSPKFKLHAIQNYFPLAVIENKILAFDDRQDICDILNANKIACLKVTQF